MILYNYMYQVCKLVTPQKTLVDAFCEGFALYSSMSRILLFVMLFFIIQSLSLLILSIVHRGCEYEFIDNFPAGLSCTLIVALIDCFLFVSAK